MTVTLELPPNIEVELSAQAAERGQAISDYLLTLAEAAVHGEPELSEADREEKSPSFKTAFKTVYPGTKAFCWKTIGQVSSQSVQPAYSHSWLGKQPVAERTAQ